MRERHSDWARYVMLWEFTFFSATINIARISYGEWRKVKLNTYFCTYFALLPFWLTLATLLSRCILLKSASFYKLFILLFISDRRWRRNLIVNFFCSFSISLSWIFLNLFKWRDKIWNVSGSDLAGLWILLGNK
jgi:hypothetical protein